MAKSMMPDNFRRSLRQLYIGDSRSAIRFQAVMACIDLAIIAFFIFGPYLRTGPSYLVLDYLIAAWIAFELLVRATIAPDSASGYCGR